MTQVTQIDPSELSTQAYNPQDINLVPSFEVNTVLSENSYIEYNVYDLNNTLLFTNYDYNSYTVLEDGQSAQEGNISQITIDPESDLINTGFDQGSYNTYYSFLVNKVGNNDERLYITEISSDRTEIRLSSNVIDDQSLINQANTFIEERNNSPFFLDFYINLGDNIHFIANNIQLDNSDPASPSILIKLYEPLPTEISLKTEMWVVTILENPLAYNIIFEEEIIVIEDSSPLKGPNFNLDLKDQVNNSTLELSYTNLINTTLTSSKNQLNSLLEEKEIDINIDYTNYSEFVHFSSAKTRLENFYYKVNLIEQYSSSLALLTTGITGSSSSSLAVSESKATLESRIDNIITNFDGYDYYLYYESSSFSWPKTNSTKPYILATTGSTAVLNWYGSVNEASPYFGGQIYSASVYDDGNKDNLIYTIPEYLREDPDNAPYELFVNMVAQHYDNIWIYYKDVSQKFNSDNRLNYGVSKDIVGDAIRDFGVKLYQNNFSNDDLYTAFLGLTPEGGLFPFPNITSSLPTPTGYEYINTLISASNDIIPLNDVNKSLYKRLYHNLPYLLKSKGTIPGLRALITSYGIPDTILRINEFGGKDKVNINDWDYYYNKYNLKFDTLGTNFITTDWTLNSLWGSTNDRPNTVQLRFKAETPTPTNYSQSLWSLDNGSQVALILEYTGSALSTGSYLGSTVDPYHKYAHLKFTADGFTNSSSIYLPFFDGNWWSVMVTNNGGTYTLYAGDKIYNGDDGTQIGYYQNSSHSASISHWTGSVTSSFSAPTTITPGGTTYQKFSGSYQEIRYYTEAITENVFKDYVMNPLSFEGNTINNSPNTLAFRASLGSELSTFSSSIHPKVTGSWIATSSFSESSDYSFNTTPTYTENTEYIFLDQPIAGLKNRITDKVRVENNVIPSGDTLSPFIRVTQQTEASASYTPNINLLEVAFSPQNEINDDIIGQLGYFNIGDYIGDPSFRINPDTSYPDLDTLRDEYFKKYLKNYNVYDFVRLIKYFDNSLFKMIKDFVPARTSLATGVVIKQHLLERNRYKHPSASFQSFYYTGSVKPQWNDYEAGRVYNPSGGTGGSLSTFNGLTNNLNITQSWSESFSTPLGPLTLIHNSQDEFYNGEFDGTQITVTTQSLNPGFDPSSLDYQPLLNNVLNSRSSSLHQDIDYSSGILTPTNFGLLISGSAPKAPVQDSNYTLLRHTNPRYNGSRSTTQKLNKWTEGDTGTYGKSPNITSLDRVIYEFTEGSGTSPEILGWGGFKMSNLYLVNTLDSVRTIQAGIDSTTKIVRSTLPPGFTPGAGGGAYRKLEYISQSFDEHYYTLNKNNPVNHKISFIQYDPVTQLPLLAASPTSTNSQTSAPILSTTRILTTDFTVPEVSSFAATSSNAKYGTITSGSNILVIDGGVSISTVAIGYTLSGSTYILNKSYNFSFLVSQNIWNETTSDPSDRWFITLYDKLEFPIDNSDLSPYNTGFSSSIDGVLNTPLAYKGVFEVLGLKTSILGSPDYHLVMSNTFHETKDIGNNDLGFLMWKAVQDGKSVLVQNSINKIGAGAFISTSSPKEVIQNLPSITKKYGINKT
jgi:hypothetical protein